MRGVFWTYVVLTVALVVLYSGIGLTGRMAIFTVYLRQRGSPESKPVGAPHTETGSSG